MKILLINGSPRENGATATAINECREILGSLGAECFTYNIGAMPRAACCGCGECKRGGKCIYGDTSELAADASEADGIVIATPTHYMNAPGTLLSLLSRLVYSQKDTVRGKPITVIGVGRRAGLSTAVDSVKRFFEFADCPIISGKYPPILYAKDKQSAKFDLEGMENLESVSKNLYRFIKRCETENHRTDFFDGSVKTDISTLSKKDKGKLG